MSDGGLFEALFQDSTTPPLSTVEKEESRFAVGRLDIVFPDNLLPTQFPELLSSSPISHQVLIKLKSLLEIIEDHPLNSTDIEQ